MRHDLKYVLVPFCGNTSISGSPALLSLPLASLGNLALDNFLEDEQTQLQESHTTAYAKSLLCRGTKAADMARLKRLNEIIQLISLLENNATD